MLGVERIIREFLFVVGVSIMVAWLMGTLGFVDFYLCIKPVGQCLAP